MDTEKIPAKKRISSKKAPELRHDFDNDGPIIIPGARISHYKPSKFDFSFIKRLDKVSKKTSKIANFILPPKPETKRNKTAFSALRKTQRVVEATSFKQTGQKIFNLRGQVASFALTGLILVFTIRGVSYLADAKSAAGRILGSATSAYDNLHSAGSSLKDQDFAKAEALFAAAQNNLEDAKSRMNQYKTWSQILPQAKSADSILNGAYLLSQSGEKLTEALKLFDDLKVTSEGIQTENFNARLRQNKELLSESFELLKLAEADFAQSSGLPKEYLPTLAVARDQISLLSGTLQSLISLEDLYLSFLGTDGKTYLLLFQNYDEIRATGGFIGTYGVLKMDSGNIKKLKIESIYDLDGQIIENIAAPGPFQPDIKKWGIRDANWFADFPASARKLLKFFEKGSETADGIITVTPKLFGDLLRLVGPIQMEQYGVVLTPDNFQDVVQEKTSVAYDKTLNQPKKFLSDFAPILLNRLTDLKKEQWFSFFQILHQNLIEKQVLLYSTDPDTQSKVENSGFAGNIKSADFDYLSVINSNLGGTKTDLKIAQSAGLSTKILDDGSIISTVKIKRQNNSVFDNRDYLRILVPLGSEMISTSGGDSDLHLPSLAEGLQTDQDLAAWDKGKLRSGNIFVRTEAGKTEFAAWVSTPANSEKEISFSYQLPFKLSLGAFHNGSSYSLLLQKQPGATALQFEQVLDFGSLQKAWSTGNSTIIGNSGTFISYSQTDDYWGVIFK